MKWPLTIVHIIQYINLYYLYYKCIKLLLSVANALPSLTYNQKLLMRTPHDDV